MKHLLLPFGRRREAYHSDKGFKSGVLTKKKYELNQ